MKKVAVLLLAAGLVFGAAHKGAQAADIKVSGEWDFNTEWNNIGFAKEKADDLFHARQRLRTQVDIIASESLKGTVFFEVGDTNWGNSSEGGALGTDGKVVEVRYSYVDWVVPQTDLRVRMGLQPFSLPNFVAGDPIMGSDDSDGAGITLSYQFNDMAGMSLFWMRAENDNTTIDRGVGNAMDFVGLSVPLTGEGWQLNPWGMYGNLGKNSLNEVGENGESLIVGLLPYGQDGVSVVAKDSNNPAWWLGIGGELTTFDPLRLAMDFYYSGTHNGNASTQREGWYLAALAEYRLPWFVPTLKAWYASGDDSKVTNGSEQPLYLSGGFKPGASSYFKGRFNIANTIDNGSAGGTWGISAQLNQMSFIDDLSHDLRVSYFRGTNSSNMPNIINNIYGGSVSPANYLTTKDHVVEVDFDTSYQIYKNFVTVLELSYAFQDFNGGVWKNAAGENGDFSNAWRAALNFRYKF